MIKRLRGPEGSGQHGHDKAIIPLRFGGMFRLCCDDQDQQTRRGWRRATGQGPDPARQVMRRSSRGREEEPGFRVCPNVKG